ncbi:hypothetical protein [Ruminiclostridium cellobioparum]|nr:hypothetical protein [Ruminiclostridium cellobioparum]
MSNLPLRYSFVIFIGWLTPRLLLSIIYCVIPAFKLCFFSPWQIFVQ